MLKKLDWYIIRNFLSTFFFTALIFTMIAVSIDFSEKVEKFVEEPITKKEILLDYYPGFILFIDGLLWPLFALISVIFFTSRMAFNSEIISIFNAGVSFNRLMRPYLVGAGLIAFLHLAGNHFFIPQVTERKLDIEGQYLEKNKRKKEKSSDFHFFISPDTKIYIGIFSRQDTSAQHFRIEHFKDNKMVSVLKAARAQWIGPPNKWRLINYEIRNFDGDKETLVSNRKDQKDTTFNFAPSDFLEATEVHTSMTTPELMRYLAKQRERGVGNAQRYEVELQRRTAEPFSIFILTLIGMAVAARKVRGGMGLHLAIGIAIGAIFVFISRFAIVFASGNIIPVLLGIWLPNIIFAIPAFYLIRNAQK